MNLLNCIKYVRENEAVSDRKLFLIKNITETYFIFTGSKAEFCELVTKKWKIAINEIKIRSQTCFFYGGSL